PGDFHPDDDVETLAGIAKPARRRSDFSTWSAKSPVTGSLDVVSGQSFIAGSDCRYHRLHAGKPAFSVNRAKPGYSDRRFHHSRGNCSWGGMGARHQRYRSTSAIKPPARSFVYN